MSLNQTAKLLVIKYAAELFDPKASAEALEKLIKDNFAKMYQKFMLEYNGNLSQLKQVYNFPHLENLHTVFAKLIANIDKISIVELNSIGIELIEKIEDIRSKLNDFIKLNKDDPAFVASFMRKRVASTVDKALESLEKDIVRQLDYIYAGTHDVKLPSITHEYGGIRTLPSGEHLTKRRRMTQTPQEIEMLVLRFGEFYGVSGMETWGKISNKDHDLAESLITAFLGMNKATRDYKKSEDYDPKSLKNKILEQKLLESKVKPELKKQVNQLLERG